MNDNQTPKEHILDLFAKHMASHFEMAATFPEDSFPPIYDVVYSQVNGWGAFLRNDPDIHIFLDDDEYADLVELAAAEPEVLKACVDEITRTFEDAEENDRIIADFVKKYARECDEERLRATMKVITGVNIWDGEPIFEIIWEDDEDKEVEED